MEGSSARSGKPRGTLLRTGYNEKRELHMPTYEIGDYVKVEFPDETTGAGEWM